VQMKIESTAKPRTKTTIS